MKLRTLILISLGEHFGSAALKRVPCCEVLSVRAQSVSVGAGLAILISGFERPGCDGCHRQFSLREITLSAIDRGCPVWLKRLKNLLFSTMTAATYNLRQAVSGATG